MRHWVLTRFGISARRHVVGLVGVQGLRTRPSSCSKVGWAEPKRDALHKLELPGAPAVLDMKDDISQWRFVGTTAKPQHLQSLMKSWRDKDK